MDYIVYLTNIVFLLPAAIRLGMWAVGRVGYVNKITGRTESNKRHLPDKIIIRYD